MSEALSFLGPAAVMCLLIASLHVYLGLHILEREVIFVDLSLAQLAAFGALLFTTLFDLEHGVWPHVGAFSATVLGAAIFAFSGRARHRVSQEAVVGIVYAVASAAMVLMLSRAPHGAERIRDTLVGTLLVVTWVEVGQVAVAYALLAILQLLFARRFLEISWHREKAEQSMANVAWWDFCFYVLFGVVITISVQIAGVLLVFSFLIVPAGVTKMLSRTVGARLFAGWLVSIASMIYVPYSCERVVGRSRTPSRRAAWGTDR